MPEDTTEATPIDERLKELVIMKYSNAIDFSIQGDYVRCFSAYKALFHLIEPYNFDLKHELREITDALTEYVLALKGKPANSKDLIRINNNQFEFIKYLHIYMSAIPKAFAELGLWFKIKEKINDFDKAMSIQNFDSEYTSLSERKEYLSKLEVKDILEAMSANQIHDAYTRIQIKNVI